MKSAQQYIDLFNEYRDTLCKHSSPLMNSCRDEAFTLFCQQGFPTRSTEEYKYTDVEALFAPDYGLNLNRLQFPVNPYEVFKCDVPNMSTALYFMVNDGFYDNNQTHVKLPEGVLLGSLKELSQSHSHLLQPYYNRLAGAQPDSITQLNTTLAQDGMVLYVSRNVQIEKTLQLVTILRASSNLMVNRRLLIILEEGAQARMLICDHNMDDVRFLTTQVIEVFAGRNSSFDLYELEETHLSNTRFSNLYVHQAEGSRVLLNGITLQNGTTRNTTRVVMAGPHAQAELYGMAITDGTEHVDNNTYIEHQASDCISRELYKYVLDEASTGAFAGKVLVRPGAQRTDSQQTNRNLCATRQARMYTQPQLEIYADDVKCSHGSAVGQLDENALFYMQQRGIPMREARMLLMFAFVNEVIDTIRIDALKDRLHLLAEKRFRKELNKCKGCAICKE